MSVVTETMAPQVERVRAYMAPVTRGTVQPTIFDPAQAGTFDVTAPPAPWVDLGWIRDFTRKSGTKIEAVRSGAPLTTQMQVRAEIEATVQFAFESWGKLQMALACGTQEMNLLKTTSGSVLEGSGGAAASAVPVGGGSTATVLQMGSAASGLAVGQLLAVDVDYTGQTGYVGSGVSGAYVRTALTDVDYIRRVSLNVGRIAAINATTGAVTLASALLAGAPSSGMKASVVKGFCDREGSSFFQEWSALFVAEGQQGARVVWHYPRLQAMDGAAETWEKAGGGFEAVRLAAAFRALPVKDPVDGETVVCFRSYLAG